MGTANNKFSVPFLDCITRSTYIDAVYCYRPSNDHVLDGGPDSSMVRNNFDGEKGRPIVQYRDTLRAKPIEMPFGLWASMGPNNHVLDRRPNPPWECAIFGERDAHSKV